MTRGVTPPRPEEEVSKLKVRVLNLERILRGLRKAKPGIFDVPSIELIGAPGGTLTTGDRAFVDFVDQVRTDSFRTKGRLVGSSELLILEAALYAVTCSVSFEESTTGGRGVEVAEWSPSGAERILTSSGPHDAEASSGDAFRASAATIVSIPAGASLELRVWQTSGGDLDIAAEPLPRLGVAWLGTSRVPVAPPGDDE